MPFEEAAVLAKWLKGITLAVAEQTGTEYDAFRGCKLAVGTIGFDHFFQASGCPVREFDPDASLHGEKSEWIGGPQAGEQRYSAESVFSFSIGV